ncbi:hypothetical protein [Cellulophaga sp. BC115SP]|uniref:hypothetical protein n=1 Tax=Cellulophaga sp. BC115SP TaxID=2683263 RepID=UPI001411F8D4|nr:hypothetical protein [Cellulophaga sp. BC115SP]NBB26988.1 hypothetical protein [Cellulophaga sp. BC115SP]
MKRFDEFMFLQWLVFLPLILPLSIATGVFQGIILALSNLISQIKQDTNVEVSHSTLWSFHQSIGSK